MKKKWLLIASVLILLGIGIYVLLDPSAPKQVLVNGTNVNAVSYSDADFEKELAERYPDLAGRLLPEGEQSSYVIPGLEQSQAIVHSGSQAGQLGLATDMDPQGMAIIEDKYVAISGYSKSKTYNSVIWLLDKDAQVEALDLTTIEAYDINRDQKAIAFDYSMDLYGVKLASYLTYHQGQLYVGYFHQTSKGVLAVYPVATDGTIASNLNTNGEAEPSQTWVTAEKIQGISFYGDKILLSQSYGSKDSVLYIFDNRLSDPKFDLGTDDAIASLPLPPYLEQIIGYQDQVFLLFESASHKYRQNPLLFHMDRIIKISIADLIP
ncbi:hypothetical protein JNE33_04705 [Streptococcus suis]|uniref:hypothetical protein n=1 Tax=Streptococcus suis TaxID=1307 RepID=UPI00192D362E|nr:hypothetical protein [Streptococcus suis]MBL6439807.1 hypothetical protein [Streptococcus suis]